MTDTIVLAETQPDPNNFLKIVEVNPPKTNNTADSPQVGGPTTPSLARGITKNTGLEKANQSRIHICDIVNELNKDIAALKSSVSGTVAQIRAAIQALFAGLASNPFTEDIKQQISTLKTQAALIEKDIRVHLNEIKAIQTYVSYLKTLIYTIEHSPAELQKLLQSCLSQANTDLTTYNTKLQALNNMTSLNEKQKLLNTTNQNLANTA
jgi:predicted  nucleic acid-binding Zn-ribbon protein